VIIIIIIIINISVKRHRQSYRGAKSVACVTNNKRLRPTFCTIEANTDRHEASRGLFATAGLLVESAAPIRRCAIYLHDDQRSTSISQSYFSSPINFNFYIILYMLFFIFFINLVRSAYRISVFI